jgi:hypothetical protein
MANPNDADADDKISTGGGTGKPRRADLLNNSPRTKAISGGGPNFTEGNTHKSGHPHPDSPYGKG